MDLMIAMQQFATVINVRQTHWAAARERDRRSGRATFTARIVADARIRRVAAYASVLEVDPVTGRDAIPEVQQPLVTCCTAAVQCRQFSIRQYPDPDTIPIRDPVFFLVGRQRMRVTRFATVFNVNPEQASA